MDRLLVLVRHGQSEWNLKNLFTGWKDPDLTEQGIREGVRQALLPIWNAWSFLQLYASTPGQWRTDSPHVLDRYVLAKLSATRDAITDALDVVQNLALQIAGINIIHVDDANCSDTSGREIQSRWRSESTGTQHQHFAIQQLRLTFYTDFRKQQVALVAIHLFGSQ